MELIRRVTVPSQASSIVINSIPGTYTNLYIKLSLRFARSAVDTPWGVKFNGSASSFASRLLFAFPTGTPGSQAPTAYVGWANAASNTANTFTTVAMTIFDYASSTEHKSFNTISTQENNGTSVGLSHSTMSWLSTSPITSIEIYDQATGSNIMPYSSVTIYGVSVGSDGTTTVS